MDTNNKISSISNKLIALENSLNVNNGYSLEEYLNLLLSFGKPTLRNFGDGWYCGIEMYVGSKGAEFNIRSDFKLSSPTIAVKQCLERIHNTIKDFT